MLEIISIVFQGLIFLELAFLSFCVMVLIGVVSMSTNLWKNFIKDLGYTPSTEKQ